MPHTSNKKKAKLPSRTDSSDEETQSVPFRSSQQDVNEPRYVNPLFPRGTDRLTQPTDDAAADLPRYALAPGSALSADGQRFARDVKLRDIPGCARFINTHPEVLTEQNIDNKYTQEAIAALVIGDPESRYLAESYVEKCLIVRNCRGKSNRAITEYLQPLADRKKGAWDNFYEDFDRIMDNLKRRVKASSRDQRSITTATTENLRSADRHAADVGDITKTFSHLQTGSLTGYDKPSFAKYQNLGAIAASPRTQDPNLRHAAVPPQGTAYSTSLPSDRLERPAPSSAQPRGPKVQGNRDSALLQGESRHGSRLDGSIDEGRSQASDPSHDSLIPSLRGNAVPKAVNESSMDPRFKKRAPREAGTFFKVGRVFATLWHTEHTSAIPDDISRAKWVTPMGLGVKVFSHVRRFAVVKEGHGYCWAVPINTYNAQGVKKSGFNRADIEGHAIIYMQGTRPLELNNEPSMPKHPIQVVPAERNCELHKASRINFAKVHTVEHNVSVLDIGTVHKDSAVYFTSYWRQHST